MNKLKKFGAMWLLAAFCAACTCPQGNGAGVDPAVSTTDLLRSAEEATRGSRLTPVRVSNTLSGYTPSLDDLDLVEQLANQRDLPHAVDERYLSQDNSRATELVESGSQFFLLVIHALMLQGSAINTDYTRMIEVLWERAVGLADRGWRHGSLDRVLSLISKRLHR